MNWNKILLSLVFALAIIYTAICYYTVSQKPTNRFQNTYNAACAIKNQDLDTIGSGCLLENGLVLTAAHVMDRDNDDIVSIDERLFQVEFGTGLITTAVVIQAGLPAYVPMDFALLQITEQPEAKGLKITNKWPSLGDPLYTIGCPDGKELLLSSGIFTSRESTKGLCSVPIFPGNSGGAIFNEKQEIVGIVSRIGNSVDRHIMFLPDGPVFFETNNYITHQNFYSAAAQFSKHFNKFSTGEDFIFRGWAMLFSLLVMVYVWIKRKTLLV